MGPGCFGWWITGSSRGAPSRDRKIKTLHVQRPRDRPVRFELRYHAGQVPTVTLDFRSSHFTPMYHATDAIAGCRVTCAVFRDTQMMYLSDKASNYAVRAAQCCAYPGWPHPVPDIARHLPCITLRTVPVRRDARQPSTPT
jgi:hypothetical protein